MLITVKLSVKKLVVVLEFQKNSFRNIRTEKLPIKEQQQKTSVTLGAKDNNSEGKCHDSKLSQTCLQVQRQQRNVFRCTQTQENAHTPFLEK